MKYLVVLILCILAIGCTIPMGENVVHISGDIDKKCQLLFVQENISPKSFNYRDIEGNFSEDFVISPKPLSYILEIKCSEVQLLTKKIKYPEKAKDLKLGHLVSSLKH